MIDHRIKKMPQPQKPEPMDEDLRRLALSTLAWLRRKFPNDWRRIVESEQQKVR